MHVTNDTQEAIVVFYWHKKYGYSNDTSIEAGQTREIRGPYLGRKDGKDSYLEIPKKFTCQENIDDDAGFQVTCGNPLHLSINDGEFFVEVRHHSDEREKCTIPTTR